MLWDTWLGRRSCGLLILTCPTLAIGCPGGLFLMFGKAARRSVSSLSPEERCQWGWNIERLYCGEVFSLRLLHLLEATLDEQPWDEEDDLYSFTLELVLHCMWGLPDRSSALVLTAWELLFWDNRITAGCSEVFSLDKVTWEVEVWWAVAGWVLFSCPDLFSLANLNLSLLSGLWQWCLVVTSL